MDFILICTCIALMAVFFLARHVLVPREVTRSLGRPYWICMWLSLANVVFASCVNYRLLTNTQPSHQDYSAILTALSLLTAGVISGYFATSYQDADESESWLLTALSIIFISLFVTLFGSIAYIVGLSGIIVEHPQLGLVLSIATGLILAAIVMHSFWDYVTFPEE